CALLASTVDALEKIPACLRGDELEHLAHARVLRECLPAILDARHRDGVGGDDLRDGAQVAAEDDRRVERPAGLLDLPYAELGMDVRVALEDDALEVLLRLARERGGDALLELADRRAVCVGQRCGVEQRRGLLARYAIQAPVSGQARARIRAVEQR